MERRRRTFVYVPSVRPHRPPVFVIGKVARYTPSSLLLYRTASNAGTGTKKTGVWRGSRNRLVTLSTRSRRSTDTAVSHFGHDRFFAGRPFELRACARRRYEHSTIIIAYYQFIPCSRRRRGSRGIRDDDGGGREKNVDCRRDRVSVRCHEYRFRR